MKSRIAVLGAGVMGSALVRAFLERGYPTSIWNRTKAKAEALAAAGAKVADTVDQAVADADIVVVNVSDYATSERLLHPDNVAKSLRGKLIVQVASGSTREARDLAAWAEQHGIAYLDGAIMATPNFVGTPECVILYSGGTNALFESNNAALSSLGTAVYVSTDPGHASALDSALLLVMWGSLFGTLQGLALVQAEKLPLQAYLDHIKPFANLVPAWAADVVERVRDQNFASPIAPINSHATAVVALLASNKERGVSNELPEVFHRLLQRSIQAGHGADDFAILNRFLR
ncbi:NAD(P)-binding domain-containing protein [Pendulispora albinea]|uniref:NAD(P)-binding domain-containing protein n=2 Tax=Pendulispora albinea TaxID=2741071 RepID=A0ABZ2LYB0_9BACT